LLNVFPEIVGAEPGWQVIPPGPLFAVKRKPSITVSLAASGSTLMPEPSTCVMFARGCRWVGADSHPAKPPYRETLPMEM